MSEEKHGGKIFAIALLTIALLATTLLVFLGVAINDFFKSEPVVIAPGAPESSTSLYDSTFAEI